MRDEDIIGNFERINKNFDEVKDLIVKNYLTTKSILTFLFEELNIPIDKIDRIEKYIEVNWQRIKVKAKTEDEAFKKEIEDFIREVEKL